MNIACILIPLIVGAICGLLGYLLGKSSSKNNNDDSRCKIDLDNCNQMNSQLRTDIERLQNQLKNQKSDMQSFVKSSVETDLVFDASAAKLVYGKTIKENDLKIIEGIGPKIEELFKTSGILTWKSLSNTSVDRCQEILTKAGERFQIHDPGTWPRQAQLAYEGKWQELKDWQDVLDGGKE